MEVGEVSRPFVMMDRQRNKEVCAVIKLRSRTNAHKANLTDDFQTIRRMLEQQESREYIDQWIRRKQQETYVQIDPAWSGCDFLYPGWIH